MNSFKINRLTFLSLFSSSFKVLVGPLTLLFLAKFLSSEELGFYYTFFSLVAMKQLLEIGMSNVLKQYYAYENKAASKSREKINNYFIFSVRWYFILALSFSILSIIVGYIYFYNYKGVVKWETSWYLLIFGTFLSILVMPFQTYLDGNQFQKELQTFNIISQVSGTFILWLALYLKLNLYAIGLSVITTSVFFVLCLSINRNKLLKISFSSENFIFKNIFYELWPLLKKTGFVWFLGYFYWNGFNIIAFKYLGPINAGIIGLSISLGRAGLNVASSIVISHMTIYAKYISSKQYERAYNDFIKNAISGLVILIIGYSLFLISQEIFKDFYFFKKVLQLDQIFWMFLFFILCYITSVMDNYTRCYKVEKFVFVQLFNSVFTPFLFFVSMYLDAPYFSGPVLIIIIVLFMTYKIFIDVKNNN